MPSLVTGTHHVLRAHLVPCTASCTARAAHSSYMKFPSPCEAPSLLQEEQGPAAPASVLTQLQSLHPIWESPAGSFQETGKLSAQRWGALQQACGWALLFKILCAAPADKSLKPKLTQHRDCNNKMMLQHLRDVCWVKYNQGMDVPALPGMLPLHQRAAEGYHHNASLTWC